MWASRWERECDAIKARQHKANHPPMPHPSKEHSLRLQRGGRPPRSRRRADPCPGRASPVTPGCTLGTSPKASPCTWRPGTGTSPSPGTVKAEERIRLAFMAGESLWSMEALKRTDAEAEGGEVVARRRRRDAHHARELLHQLHLVAPLAVLRHPLIERRWQ